MKKGGCSKSSARWSVGSHMLARACASATWKERTLQVEGKDVILPRFPSKVTQPSLFSLSNFASLFRSALLSSHSPACNQLNAADTRREAKQNMPEHTKLADEGDGGTAEDWRPCASNLGERANISWGIRRHISSRAHQLRPLGQQNSSLFQPSFETGSTEWRSKITPDPSI